MAKKDEVEIKLTVDTSELDKADDVASDFPSEITLDVNANVDTGDLSALEDLDGQTIEPTIDVQETDTGKQILDGVNFLVLKEKFELVMNIVGTAWDFLGKAEAFLVAPFLDVEDAVARINAQTGTAIPDLDQMIRDIQAADLGESVDQIANVVIHAQQIGQPMQEAAVAALSFTKVFENENPETVLDTLNTLVSTGLVPNLQEAADLMTVFFQQGGNVGGDALAVVNANSQSWADMGLTAGEALSTLDSLQQGTGATATDAAKMLQTFDDAMTAAAADPTSEQANMLRLMGITNPKDAGEAIGAETIDGFAAAFDNLASDKQDLISGLFFGKGGKKFTGAIEGMTTQNNIYQDYIDAAADAGVEIDNSLRGAIADFVLEINTSIARLLSSEEIDLPGKIADLKEGFQKAATTLAQGGSLGDALSVGFRIEGVDTALLNIERVFGQFVIAMLEVVALIQDPLGINDADKGTRAEIARLATKQVPFDIKVANPDELDAIFNQAINRGVTAPDALAGLTTALDELVAASDFSKVIDIVKAIENSEGITPEAIQVFQDKYIAPLSTAFDAAIESGDFDLAKKISDAQDDPTAYTDALKGKFGFDAAAFDQMAADFAAGMEAAIAAETPTPEMAWADLWKVPEDVTTSITNFERDVDTAMTNASLVTALASDDMLLALAAMSDGVVTADEQIALYTTGNTITASFEAVALSAEENLPIVIEWFDQASASVLAFDGAAAGLSTIAANLVALQAAIVGVDLGQLQAIQTAANGGGSGGGGGGDTNNTNQTVTQNNVITNGAQATNSAYQLANMLS